MAGIRHRRQLLSLRVHGERNRLVLSAFESLPGALCNTVPSVVVAASGSACTPGLEAGATRPVLCVIPVPLHLNLSPPTHMQTQLRRRTGW